MLFLSVGIAVHVEKKEGGGEREEEKEKEHSMIHVISHKLRQKHRFALPIETKAP